MPCVLQLLTTSFSLYPPGVLFLLPVSWCLSVRPSVNQDYDYDRLTPDHLMPVILSEDVTVDTDPGNSVTLNCQVDKLGKLDIIRYIPEFDEIR